MAGKKGELAIAAMVVGVAGLVFVAYSDNYHPTVPQPTHSTIPYRPATERERLDHDLKQAWEKDQVKK